MKSIVKRINLMSAWLLIQAMIFSQIPPGDVWALRVEQTESKTGLEELEGSLKTALQRVSAAVVGLEEPRALPQAISRWFKADAAAQEEQALENWLAARGEERIRRFVERVIDQVDGLADLRQFGAFEVPAFDPAALPAPGQRSGSYAIPSSTEEFERERVRMMAHIAVRRAFGHLRGKPIQVVANVGIGYVGTAVTIVTADADRYVAIAYQRPSKDSSQKVNRVNEGKMPVRTADVTAPARLKAAVERGDLTATFLIESLAVADLIMLETELHFSKYYPKQIDQGQSDPEASLHLIRQVGSVMQPHATMLIESTVPPGFIEQEAWPALTETLRSVRARRPGLPVLPADRQANMAYAFQRLEPGPRWLQSLMEYKRIGAALTPEAREALEEYFRSVGFKSWEIWSNPSAVAALKDLENAYRVGLIEITGGFLRGLEKLRADAWQIFAEIAADRPETHGSIRFIPAIQEGQGYCCPKELGEFIAGLKRNYGVSDLQIKQLLSTRIDAIAVSDFRAEDYAYWLMGALDNAGLSLRDSNILVAGASYKPGVGDTRWTGAERLIRRLAHQGAHVSATDPYVKYWPEFHGQQIRDPESWAFHLNHQEALRGLPLATVPQLADAVGPQVHGIVLATRHWQYVGRHQLAFLRTLSPANPVHQVFRQMFEGIDSLPADEKGLDAAELSARRMGIPGGVIVDTFNFLHDNDIKEFLALGWQVLGSGKGHIPLLAGEITPLDRFQAHQRLVRALELQAFFHVFGADKADPQAALRAARAQVALFKAQVNAAGVEETDLAQAQADLAQAKNALRHAVPSQSPVLKAKIQLAQARIRHLKATTRAQKEGSAERVGEAEFQLQRTLFVQQQQVVEAAVTDVVDPTLRVVASLVQSGGAELNALGKAGLPFLRHPASAEEAAEIAEALVKLGDEVQGLRFRVDALMEAILSPEGKARMWQEMARLRARPELAVPNPRTDLSGKILLPDTIPVLPGTYPVGDENGPLYYARGPDNRLHRMDRRPWNATDFNALTLKVVPDLAQNPAHMPQAWGRVSVTSPLYLTPAVAPDGKGVIHGFEAYPGAFDQLPPEFRRWLLQDVLSRGLAPTTMDGEHQSAVGLVMQVNLQTTTPARGRGGAWFDAASRQPFFYTADGFEWLLDVKALGPYGGGNPVTLEYNEDRVVSGGREKAGTVAQSRLGQLIGFQQDWSEIHNLWMLRGTEAWEKGWVSRPVFVLRFQFAGNPQHTLAMVARGVPTNERLGQSHIGQPDYVSNRIGWNTAEILLYPQSAVHIALTADNIMSNGYATDMGSLIWLHNERDPKGALNKYGGFSMQIPLFTFREIKVNDFSNPRGQFLVPWVQGFRERFLESRVGRERIRNPEQFAEILNPANPLLTEDPNQAIDVLMETLWRHYLPWQLLKERLEFGYGPTRESTYSQTSGTGYLPASYQRAKKFIADQRELLTIAQRLIQKEGYPELDFDFDQAFQVLARKERAIKRGAESYADAYDLSEIYPAVRPSVIPVISNLDEMARGAQPVRTTMTRMAPSVMADKAGVEFVVAGKPAASTPKGGLEEQALFTVEGWERIAADPEGFGLRKAIESYVPAPYVDKEFQKAVAVIREAVRRNFFVPGPPVALVRTTGRARLFMGHPDLAGIGDFSIDAATHQSIWMLVQLTNDGKVIADNMDPQYGPLKEFGIRDEDVLPINAEAIVQPRPDWLSWAQSHTFENRWEGLVKGTLAVIRTKMLDPSGDRRRLLQGFRMFLSTSDIPSGKGFSASSSIPAGIGLGLNALWEGLTAQYVVMTPDQLRKLDYAAYVVDDLAGVADITAILEGELGQATVLWYDPDRVGQKLSFPDGFRVFAFDSNIRRLNHTSYPPSVQNYGKNIQTLTNISVPLAILWLRMLAINHPKDLGFLEEVLTAHWPSGVMRELTETPDAAIQDRKYAAQIVPAGQKPAVGYGAKQKRRVFVEQVMARVPNEWTLGNIVAALREGLPPTFYPQIDSLAQELVPLGAHEVDARTAVGQRRLQQMRNAAVIPMRQMAWYGMEEAERGLRYIAAAERGNTAAMLHMMREAHGGDRALYDPNQPFLAGTPRLTTWGLSNPPEAFQRSLVEIDRLVDRFERDVDNQLGTGVAARVSGAGLGGLIMAAVDEKRAPGAYEAAVKWLGSRRPAHEVIGIAPSAGVRVIRLPRIPASAKAAGVEELTSERLEGLAVRGQPVRSLLQKIPAALDPWLDKPVRVGLWVADFDHTLNVPSTGPLSQPIKTPLADSVIDHGALLWVNSGSAVGDASTNMEERFLVPIETEFEGRSAQASLQGVKFMGGVGQQLVSYDSAGVRQMRGIPAGPAFTPEQQVATLKRWLTLFVEEYPTGTDRDVWKTRIQENNDPTAFRQIALGLAKAWGIARLDIALRGVDPETGVLSSNRPGMITLMLPRDGSLRAMARRMAEVFDQELRSSMPAGLKATVPGAAFVTVLFYAKEDQILDEYQRIASQLPSDNGIVVTLGDNPGSDTFFNLTSSQFGRPVLHFLVDSNFAAGRPDLLVPDQKFVEGSQQVIEAFVSAQGQGRSYRETPFLPGGFSIADLERETGYSWNQLRAAALAGAEETPYEVDGTDVRILQTIRLRAGDRAEVITLPNGSTIEAKTKGAVLIEPGTLIQSGVKVVAPAGKTVTVLGGGTVLQTGTVIDGQVWVGRNVKVDAQLRGQTWLDHNAVFTPGSQTVVEDSVLAQRGSKSVSVKQSTGINNSVLWGSSTFQDAVVTESIMDFAIAGNHTFQSRSRLAGVSAQHVTSAGHFNALISMFNLPLAQWRDLSDPGQRQEAFLDLLALRYGELVGSREVTEFSGNLGHSKRPLEELTLSFNGQQRTVLTRASNLGGGFTTSNLKTREGSWWTKGPTLFWGGVMAGVQAITTAPAELGPSSVLANNAGLAGQVIAPGTLVVPEAALPGKGIKEGRMDAREGRLSAGVLENLAVRLQVMQALEILARVAAEGASRAQSPAQRAGYRKEVELLGKFHAETVTDLRTYLAVVKYSALNLQKDLERSPDPKTVEALKEQRTALGIDEPMYQVTAATQEMAPYNQRIADSSAVVRQAAEAVSQPPRYPMAEVVRFENPDGVFELTPGSPAMNGAVIADGQQKVRNRQVLGIIFVAGKGGRFKDSVASKSPEYGQRAVELDRSDTDGDVIKFAAPVGVSNFPAVLRQLEAFAELGFRARQPFEVALVDSIGNREMLVRLLEADRRSARPRVRWEFLNFVGARPDGTMVLVNGATLQEVDPATGKPVPGTQARHSHVPLVDQGEGLPATYAADVAVGGVQHKKGEPVLQWNPASGQRDLPYKVPSGEYGALMAGVNAARAAGIDVARRDLLPTYGDQVELYSDPDRLAALLGSVDRADVTGVSIPHRLVNERDPATGRPKWDPDGGGIVKAIFPDGEEPTLIVERDVRDPARAADRIYNAKLDEQEVALAKASGVGYPYNAAPPVFSASFVSDLLNARVDIRHQRKDRQIPFGPGSDDRQLVPIQVTELEMTHLMQIASQQGRAVQVARAPREARQALKGADDIPPANAQLSQSGRERLRRLLGERLKGDPAHVEVAPSARSFFATGEGSLTVTGNVGIEIDRWGVWARRYEGESPFAGGSGIANFSRGRRLVIPATSDGVIPLDRPVVINEQTFDALALSSIPQEANPLSDGYVPARYEIPSPALSTPSVEYAMDAIDPVQVARDVKAGKRVVIRTKHDRVGQELWQLQSNREELHELYGLVYDVAEGRTSLTDSEIGRVVELLNHSNQAVAAAARDVIVKARVHGLGQTVRDITLQYQRQSATFGPYAEQYFEDALTAFTDPTHKMELGSPSTPIFAGEMSEARMRELHEQLKLWVDPKSKLSLLTGSGQRMAAPIGLVEAGFTPRPNGKPTGFPSAELASDIGSQPHDVVKILFALVAKLFVENMPRWRQELGRTDEERRMPDEWSVAIGMDPRSSSPAIFQVAARIFRKMGVGVKFTGITSAPEAAARALLSDPEEHLLASYEITPSHIKQGHQGTKLMLWLGQILPWAKAEEFNRLIRAAAQDFEQVKAVMQMLQDPASNAEVEAIMRQMPEDYADSKKRYQHYLKQSATGYFGDDSGVLEQKVQELGQDLRAKGITVVLDNNGGARITDLPLFDELAGGYVVIGANAAEFAHPLPPGEVSANSLRRFAEQTANAFEAEGLTPLLVNPDPDGDRKGVVYRDPVTGKFLYMDPQYGFMLDVVNLSMSARAAGKQGVGVTSNDATTPSVQILAGEDRLDYRYWPAEVGEANVVKGLNQLLVELAERYGDRRLIAAGGGEGSAAAFIGDLVQVRDMFQAFGSMFNLYRKPEWVKQLIDLLVDNEQVKSRLKNEVDTVWYQPDQLQYLLHRIVHRILPPMRNADPGYETEVHLGVGTADQRAFKDTADQLLVQDGAFVQTLRRETAALISEVIREPVSPEQIAVSEPINNIEEHQLRGAGNRTLPDGRVIHDGGYEIQISYTASADTKNGGVAGRTYYLYKLWLRRSKTEIGVTRRLILPVAMFMAREDPATGQPKPEVDQFLNGLFERIYPRWLAFLNELEAAELKRHLEGAFGLDREQTLSEISDSLDTLLTNTPIIRRTKFDKLAVAGKSTYSETDAVNIAEQDAAAEGARSALSFLLQRAEPFVKRLRDVQNDPAVFEAAARELRDQLVLPPEPSAPLFRNELASRLAKGLTAETFQWKMDRVLGDFTQPSAETAQRFAEVVENLKTFAVQGAAYPNLVVAKIILSREKEPLTQQAGVEESIQREAPSFAVSAGVSARSLVILTPETARVGLEALSAVRPPPPLAVIARDAVQEAEITAGLEEAGLALAMPILTLEGSGQTLAEMVLGAQMTAWANGLETYVVHTFRDLGGIAQFLQFIPASVRAWTERVQRLTAGTSA